MLLLAAAGWYWWTSRITPIDAKLKNDPKALQDLADELKRERHPGQALEAINAAVVAASRGGADESVMLELLLRSSRIKQVLGMYQSACADAELGAGIQATADPSKLRFKSEQAAVLVHRLGRYPEGIALYESLLNSADPDQPATSALSPYLGLYTIYCCEWGEIAKGRQAIAVYETLARSSAMDKHLARGLDTAAMGALQLGLAQKAEQLYRDIIRIVPLGERYKDPQIAEQELASLLAWSGWNTQALALYQATLAKIALVEPEILEASSDGSTGSGANGPASRAKTALHELRAGLLAGEADAYALDQQFSDALPLYEKALHEIAGIDNWRFRPVQLQLAYARIKLGCFSEAQAALDAAEAYDPFGLSALPGMQDLRIPLLQGMIYTGQKQYAAAQLALQRTQAQIRRAGRQDDFELRMGTYISLGELAEARGKLNQAEADYRKALEVVLRHYRQAPLNSSLAYSSRNPAQLPADHLLALLKRQGRTTDAAQVQSQLDALVKLRDIIQGRIKPASADASKAFLEYRQAQTRANLLQQFRSQNLPAELRNFRGWLFVLTRDRGADRKYRLQGWRECCAIDKEIAERVAAQQGLAAQALAGLNQLDPQTAALLGS